MIFLNHKHYCLFNILRLFISFEISYLNHYKESLPDKSHFKHQTVGSNSVS